MLDFYVTKYYDTDTLCVNNNNLDYLKNIKNMNCNFTKKYALTESIFMFANDAAWPSDNECNYNENSSKNNADFVLCFDNDELVGICMVLLKDVLADDEICVTYGWNYWS